MSLIQLAIVEDADEVREGLCQYLQTCSDFSVVGSYSTAEEAIAKLPQLLPDIVIMDIHLPGRDGISCIVATKRKCPSIQFIMFTIYENDDQVFEALKAGATGYLLKNTQLSQIELALRELYAGGSPMSSTIARKIVSAFQQKGVPNGLLTQRELQILQLLSTGLLYKEIAHELSLGVGTVRQHLHRIYEKLHVQNRSEAINKYYGRC